jgi:hypothetical protein
VHGETAVCDVPGIFTRLAEHLRGDVKPKAAREMPGQGQRQTPGAAAEVKRILTADREPEPRAVAQQCLDCVPTGL